MEHDVSSSEPQTANDGMPTSYADTGPTKQLFQHELNVTERQIEGLVHPEVSDSVSAAVSSSLDNSTQLAAPRSFLQQSVVAESNTDSENTPNSNGKVLERHSPSSEKGNGMQMHLTDDESEAHVVPVAADNAALSTVHADEPAEQGVPILPHSFSTSYDVGYASMHPNFYDMPSREQSSNSNFPSQPLYSRAPDQALVEEVSIDEELNDRTDADDAVLTSERAAEYEHNQQNDDRRRLSSASGEQLYSPSTLSKFYHHATVSPRGSTASGDGAEDHKGFVGAEIAADDGDQVDAVDVRPPIDESDKAKVQQLLNTLVGRGEFDIENNYVIETTEGLAKCLTALEQQSAHLQAQVWSVVVPVIRKTTINLLVASEADLTTYLLNKLPSLNDINSELAIDLLGVLTRFNITVQQLKLLLQRLRVDSSSQNLPIGSAYDADNGAQENGDLERQQQPLSLHWPRHSVKLLRVLLHMPERSGPRHFFSFRGTRGSCIALPPIAKWPCNSGFTYTQWLRIEPRGSVLNQDEKPYLFCFFTNKGAGYSGYLTSDGFEIAAMKSTGRGLRHSIVYDFPPRKWFMLTLIFIYNRWSKSEIKCFVNGEEVASSEVQWYSHPSNETLYRNFLGGLPSADEKQMFAGQMGAVYVFQEALAASHIAAIHALGCEYMGLFRFESECNDNAAIRSDYRDELYDGFLNKSIAFTYNPVACDGQLCLESSPKETKEAGGGSSGSTKAVPSCFLHTPHAMMQGAVQAVSTQNLFGSLHSIGGIQVLFPLFEQLDIPVRNSDWQRCDSSPVGGGGGGGVPAHMRLTTVQMDKDSNLCTLLLRIIRTLLTRSSAVQHQLLMAHGIAVISHCLMRPSCSPLINGDVLGLIIQLTRFLMIDGCNENLVKQVLDFVIFNPALWIYTTAEVQIGLYKYLAGDFVDNNDTYSKVHRVGIVVQIMHSLKYYYFLVNPMNRSGIMPRADMSRRPQNPRDIRAIRALMLGMLRKMLSRDDGIKEDELDALLNYVHTVHEDENIHDVLQLMITLMQEQPASMVPAFDVKNGVRTTFKLLASQNEIIRIQALKLLSFFLRHCTVRRKMDVMGMPKLFALLTERLALHSDRLTLAMYQTLWELVIEEPTSHLIIGNVAAGEQSGGPGGSRKTSNAGAAAMSVRIQNAQVLEVIAHLLRESRPCPEQLEVTKKFLSDLTISCSQSRDNKRALLQLSVWQQWLLDLTAYSMVTLQLQSGGGDYNNAAAATQLSASSSFGPKEEAKITDMVFGLLRMLLYHAIKYEFGGWRVWVDTLAILHTKVSRELFERKFNSNVEQQALQRRNSKAGVSKPTGNSQSPATSAIVRPVNGHDSVDSGTTTDRKLVREESEIHANSSIATTLYAATADEDEIEETEVTDAVHERKRAAAVAVAETRIAADAEKKPQDVGDNDESQLQEAVEQPPTDIATLNVDDADVAVLLDTKHDELPSISAIAADQQNSQDAGTPVTNERDEGEKQPADAKRFLSPATETSQSAAAAASSPSPTPSPSMPPFHIPHFSWSAYHQRLLSDLLFSIETDIQAWKSHTTREVLDIVKASENELFIYNTLHVVSQCVDNLVIACGGLLPLLALATSPVVTSSSIDRARSDSANNVDVGALEPNQGLPADVAISFLHRIMHIVDIVAFASTVPLDTVEKEKNMRRGGVLRQCLRLTCTCAVRNCLECRIRDAARRQHQQRRMLMISGGSSSSAAASINAAGDAAVIKLMPSASIDGTSTVTNKPSPAAESAGSSGSFMQEQHSETIPIGRQQQQAAATKRHILSMVDAVQPTPENMIGNLVLHSFSVENTDMLLQEMDINRLQAVVYRDVEDTKPSQFLALATVYFLSVLMVSRYRDLLEAQQFEQQQATAEQQAGSAATNSGGAGDAPATIQAADNSATENDADKRTVKFVSSHVGAEQAANSPSAAATANNAASVPAQIEPLIDKLERSLKGTSALFREIINDFPNFFSRTLIGSQGQELMKDRKVSRTIKESTSIVELVMLLCSQEWQNSLQKHAGLAFIELVNEGRVLSNNMKDHILRVCNEAQFILNRVRADNVIKHAEFESNSAQSLLTHKETAKICDSLIMSARGRFQAAAKRALERVRFCSPIVTDNTLRLEMQGKLKRYWKLDTWEDDFRRRRRLMPNAFGTTHADAVVHSVKPAQPTTTATEKTSSITVDDAAAGAGDVPAALQAKLNKAATSFGFQDTSGQESGNGPSGSSSGGNAEDELEGDIGFDNMQNNNSGVEQEMSGDVSFSTHCQLIWAGIPIPGVLSITTADMYFDCDDFEDNVAVFSAGGLPAASSSSSSNKFKQTYQDILKYCDFLHAHWSFVEIRAVFSRRYMLQNVGLEVFLSSRTAVMFAFPDQLAVRRVVKALPAVGVGTKYGLPQTRRASLLSPRSLFRHSTMTQRWQRREITNFEYLMFLNTITGRTYNDLNQYPIFPWILTNYDADELDLTQPTNFRDLSKPIGALNPKRRKVFEDRYAQWEHAHVPPFHYGTHYSTAAFVLGWLFRLEPFSSLFINLHGGKFDHADRLFTSVGQAWRNCQRDTSDVKELIPELFYLPEMVVNSNNYELGRMDDGSRAGEPVQLPAWAKTPEEFVRKHRMALESDLVSCQLHAWIDLIFGYKQRGPEAVKAVNVFYHLTYEGSVDLEAIAADGDEVTRLAVENQIRNFGQTPCQLLLEPHPPRSSLMHLTPTIFTRRRDIAQIIKFPSNSPIVYVQCNTYPQLAQPHIILATANRQFCLCPVIVNDFSSSAAIAAAAAVTPTSNRNNLGRQDSSATASRPSNAALAQPRPSVSASTLFGNTSSTALGNAANNHLIDENSGVLSKAVQSSAARRSLGDGFDERMHLGPSSFAATVDGRHVMVCGLWDNSFRIYSSMSGSGTQSAGGGNVPAGGAETTIAGRLVQAVYGHYGVVTCLCRSESNIISDCYVASGSADCTVLLWIWSAKQQRICGDPYTFYDVNGRARSSPIPKATLTGHEAPITAIALSAELGFVFSSSGGEVAHDDGSLHVQERCVLQHTTSGELLRALQLPERDSVPRQLAFSREGLLLVLSDASSFTLFSLNGQLLKSRTNLLNHADRANNNNNDDERVQHMIMTRDGEYFACATPSGSVTLWRTFDLERVHEYERFRGVGVGGAAGGATNNVVGGSEVGTLRSMAFTHNLQYLVIGTSSGHVVVLSLDLSRFHVEYQTRYELPQPLGQ